MELCLSSISSLYLFEFGGVFNELLSFFFWPLIRSLRVVCYSWNAFVEFSAEGKVTKVRDIHKPYGKKRKVLVDDSLIEGLLTSSSMKSKGIPLSLGKQCQKDLMHGSKHCRTTRLPFESAKDCLLSRIKSLQNLHNNSLCPFNPQVLLQRCASFLLITFLSSNCEL